MRIVLINWAKIWDGATHGGGVNGYCQALALELVERGHEVVYLCGGTTFVQCGGGTPGPCIIRRHEDWLGIRVFEVVNSPVIAPSLWQFKDPAGEMRNPAMEREMFAFFGKLRPDIVHFHNIEGFTSGCVDAASRAGARVVFSLHNYHTICPQVYLMQGHKRPCLSFDNGHSCVGCVEAVDPAEARRQRAIEHARAGRSRFIDRMPTIKQALKEVRDILFPRKDPGRVAVPVGRGLPGHSLGEDLLEPLPPVRDEDRGKAKLLKTEGREPIDGAGSPSWEPLANDPTPEPASVNAPNAYAVRREAMVGMLNRCDAVLAVSEFVRRKFEAMGVRSGVIRTQHIGTRINLVVERNRELVFDPPPFEPARERPIRLVFMGYNNWYKGLAMLADSLELLPPVSLRRFHLSLHALDGQSIEWRFRRLQPRLAGLHMTHGYETHDIPWMLGGKDLGLVTSVWWDNAPQTVFEYFACGVPVLGANLGGIPDFVSDGFNGLLFRGNDREDLARQLIRVADDPLILNGLRRNVRPPKDIRDHAVELEQVYQECISSAVTGGPRGTPAGVSRVGDEMPRGAEPS